MLLWNMCYLKILDIESGMELLKEKRYYRTMQNLPTSILDLLEKQTAYFP